MYRAELTQIAETIWESVLQMALVPMAEETPMPPPAGAPAPEQAMLTASVGFIGAWEGEVLATLSETLARSIAGAMLDSKPEELAREDVLDAVGEIVNMLGGNVKALLPPPCRLSLPRVVSGHITARPPSRHWVREELLFSCQKQPLQISFCAAPSMDAGPG